MEFFELQKQALEVRDRYAELTKKQGMRPWRAREHTEGFVGDVGDLVKLVMAREGYRNYPELDAKIAHELSDCLWSVIVLADELGVDIETSFVSTMDELRERTR